MKNHDVVIAGGGPVGLMLAAELALAKIDVAIVERRRDQSLPGSRSRGLHSRTIEVLDQRGVAGRFIAQGEIFNVAPFAQSILDISDLPSRHNYFLGLWQSQFERILADWVAELGVTTHRERDVIDFTQDETGVDVGLSGGESVRAKYLVGCDGARSVIRKKAGIDFPGWDASTSYLIAEGSVREEPAWGLRRDARGMQAIAKHDGDKRVRLVLSEPYAGQSSEATLADVRAALVASYGSDFGLHDATWVSRFSDMTRQAATYRKERVLLAGDAAHLHSPVGGQGLNLGVQDAVNLGWKLAQVVHEISPPSLLDTYSSERHPVGARVLKNTMAITALERGDARTEALREMVSDLVHLDEPRKRYIAKMSGLDIHYDLGEGHPLLGRRMPDLEVSTASGKTRVFTLLHEARPILLNLAEASAIDISPWSDRVRTIHAQYTGMWELPVIGAAPTPTAVLIRPDGYVAWIGTGTDDGLRDALVTWFGAPITAMR